MLNSLIGKFRAGTRRSRQVRRKGAIIYLVAFLILALMACVAFSIDVAYMQLSRTQLRVTTDLSARAGAEAMQRTNNATTARTAAKNIALANKVAGTGFVLNDSDIVFGKAVKNSSGVAVFTANSTPFNATRIVASRTTGSTNGNVQLFFGKLFNNTSFQPSMAATVSTPGFLKRDITLVLDRSGSMEESAGGGQTKWQALLTALGYFRTAIESTEDTEKIGLASYSDSGSINRDLTTNYNNVASSVLALDTDGTTNITDGITKGISIATGSGNRTTTDSEVERVMVVLTDGLHNQGTGPTSKISALNSAGIRVIAITFGSGADQATMKTLAESCNGKHYHAPTGAALMEIFTQIGLGLDGLQYVE